MNLLKTKDRIKKNQSPILTLTMLITIFGLPMLLAWWLYDKHIIWGNKTTNHGILLSPPLQIKALQRQQTLPEKWLLILFYPKTCQQACQKSLHMLQQIQRANGKNQNRIAIMLLSYQDQLQSHYPQLILETVTPDAITGWLKAKKPLEAIQDKGGIFISDPHGNMMLAYPIGVDYMDIFKDLRHLLRISQPG